jgi:methyl-accepting chemotaxis protein
MSIRVKIILAVSFVGLIFFSVGLISFVISKKIEKLSQASSSWQKVIENFGFTVSIISEAIKFQDSERLKEVQPIIGEILESAEKVSKAGFDTENFTSTLQEYMVLAGEVIRTQDLEKAATLSEKASFLRKQVFEIGGNILSRISKLSFLSSVFTLTSAIGVSVIFVVLSLVFSGRIVSAVEKFLKVFNLLTKGEIKAVDIKGQDEMGRLAFAWNSVSQEIIKVLKDVQDISDKVKELSSNVKNEIMRIYNATARPAQNIVAISNAVEEFSATINEVKKRLEYIVSLSKSSVSVSVEGASKVSALSERVKNFSSQLSLFVQKLKNLSDEISKVKDIVSTIEDIADQTNLLALNASIEAARAGDAGKGFAVVAQEVRKLAEKTMTEAKSITQIVSSVTKISEDVSQFMMGVKGSFEDITNLMGEIVVSFSQIQDASKSSSDEISSLSTSFEQQVRTVEEIAKNIREISEIGDEISKFSDVAKRVSDDLLGLASRLKEVVKFFKV